MSLIQLFLSALFFISPLSLLAQSAEARRALDLPLSENEKTEVGRFAHQYHDLNAVLSFMIGETAELSDSATAIYEALQECEVLTDENLTSVSINGDDCKINYSRQVAREYIGLNENGDPIHETKKEAVFEVVDKTFSGALGISAFRLNYSDRSETLVSTPVEMLMVKEHIHFLTDAGKEIETDQHSRFYSNLEIQENTYFREQSLKFENFTVFLDLRIETTFEGAVKNQFLRVNNCEAKLEEALSLLTDIFVGVQQQAEIFSKKSL